ncbi:MAG: SPOR domain-containing protein [Thermodesulfobacteriota bacterium]
MSEKTPSPKKSKLVPLFVTFAVLFIVVFALGVIIGNGLGGSDSDDADRSYEVGVYDEVSSEPDMNQEEIIEETDEVVEEVSEKAPEKPSRQDAPPPAKEVTQEEREEMVEKVKEENLDIVTRKQTPKPPAATPKPKQETKAESKEEVLEELKEAQLEKAPNRQDSPPPPPATSSLPKTDPSGKYTVQLAALQNEAQANQLMNSLTSKGYPAFIKKYSAPDNKMWYRVRVGTFTTKQQATQYGDQLKKQQSQVKSVFITTNN